MREADAAIPHSRLFTGAGSDRFLRGPSRGARAGSAPYRPRRSWLRSRGGTGPALCLRYRASAGLSYRASAGRSYRASAGRSYRASAGRRFVSEAKQKLGQGVWACARPYRRRAGEARLWPKPRRHSGGGRRLNSRSKAAAPLPLWC
ncbi:uncharacterized protein [Aphelocoma coerulescens]|uniref:uncharacterized protein isoform X7 n=1 Tax=Aphelocoma coerulescens TaxID=39617 RepID=UPI0036049CBD